MAPYFRIATGALAPPPTPSTSPAVTPISPTSSTAPKIPIGVLPANPTLLAQMEEANAKELARLDERLQEAEKTEGESEISEALRARADHLTRIGDKEKAVEAQTLALAKTPGLGSRIDIVLTLARIGFFFGDNKLVTDNLAKAEKCAFLIIPLFNANVIFID